MTKVGEHESKRRGGSSRTALAAGRNNGSMTFIFKYWQFIIAGIIAFTAVFFGFLIYFEAKSSITNLVHADIEQLKEQLVGKAGIYYCHQGRGESETTPSVYTDLQKLIGSEYSFAILDCNQKLPSGKTIYERYNLNKKIAPTIFGVAPWAKPVQAAYSNMKDVGILRSLFESKLAARANIITSTSDLLKSCGWNSVTQEVNQLPPCIAVAKGTRYNDDDAAILRNVMKAYTKPKYVIFNGKDRRLNAQDLSAYSPQRFGARYYALKNTSYYLSLTSQPDELNVFDFVSRALSSDISEYKEHSSSMGLLKYTADRIKDNNADYDSGTERGGKTKKRSSNKKERTEQQRDGPKFPSAESTDDDDSVFNEKARLQREANIRARMEQEGRDYLFDFEEDEGGSVDAGSIEDERSDTFSDRKERLSDDEVDDSTYDDEDIIEL